jgi:hypothetical protein
MTGARRFSTGGGRDRGGAVRAAAASAFGVGDGLGAGDGVVA